MASTSHPGQRSGAFFPEAYDAESLAILQQAFDAAWAELHRPGHGPAEGGEDEMRTRLSEKIMALAAGGAIDAETLSSRALQSFQRRS
jgi:hypothetical protein